MSEVTSRPKRDFKAAWKKDDMTKHIYVTGQPRSGTTWLERMLGDVLDSPLVAHQRRGIDEPEYFGEGRDGGYLIRKTNINIVIKPDTLAIFTERDPRDVAVSRYYFRGEGQPIQGVIKTMYNSSLPYETLIYLAEEAEFEAYTRYEWLHITKGAELQRILLLLDIDDVSMEKCDAAFKNQTIDAITERYGERFLGSVRKGIVGDWKNIFTRADAEYMHEHFGDFMIERGYIEDDSWIEEVE